MKKNIILIVFALLLFGGCKKDKDVHVAKVQAETPDVTTTANAADISGTYSYASTLKSVVIAYGKDASLSSPQKATAEHTRDSYSVTINDLEPSTTYYYYCIFDTGYGASESEQWSFTTQATVTTAQVSDITQTTATCGGNVTSNGSVAVTARGVCWSTSPNPTVSNSHTTDGSGTGSFTSSITGLTANTTYYVRAYATDGKGASYGEQRNFTTQATVTTAQMSNITQTTATCGGNVTSGGGAAVTARGVCWSTSPNPTVSNSHTTDGTGTGSFTSSIMGLTANTTYYVRAYATNSAGTSYGEQKNFTTDGGTIAGHEYVDLGLPSGLLWATCNVGADSPEDYGDYFAWGETETKDYYDWDTYKWCNGNWNNLTKYCTNSYYGTVDNKTVLDLEDDAARVNWGGDWRMPTYDEKMELENNCTSEWTTQNGVNGSKFTGPNGHSIFLPAAGYYYGGGSLNYAGSYGNYWSSSLYTGNPTGAYYLDFSSGMHVYDYGRDSGRSVRPVCPSRK